MKKWNNIFLIIYIINIPIQALLTPVLPSFVTEYGINLCLIIICLISNHFRINTKFLLIYTSIFTFFVINLIFSTSSFVFADGFNLLYFSFVPFYIISLKEINLESFYEMFYKTSIFLIILLPYYFLLRKERFINYFDLGFICHLSIIGICLCLIKRKQNYLINSLLISINLIVGLIYGSRSVVLSSVLVITFTVILILEHNVIKKFSFIMSGFLVTYFIYLNLSKIINYLSILLENKGISSRNLFMLKNFVAAENSPSVDVLSGRNEIYPLVINFLKQNPLFPNGFGMARLITDNKFYHSHNFILDLFLILGIPLGSIFIIYLIYKAFLYNFKIKKIYLYLISVLSLSFLGRSLFGTFFIKDGLFLTSLAMIVFKAYYRNEERIANS